MSASVVPVHRCEMMISILVVVFDPGGGGGGS